MTFQQSGKQDPSFHKSSGTVILNHHWNTYNEEQMPLMNQDLLEFLEKILENNFALSDAEETTSLGLSIEEVSRFTFVEKTISNLPKVLRANFWEVMGCFVLLPYPILAVSRTLLQQLLV